MGNTYAQSVVDFGTDLQSTKYYESMNAANPPAGEWYAVDYDDSSWSTYTNPLDFPEYDAFWVRRTFFISDDPANHSFQLQLAHDDGAVLYINGQLFHDDWACCGRYNYYDVPSEYLVNGTNVLAAYVIDTGGDQCLECFISATDGSDIIFDLPAEPTLMLSKSNIRLYYGVPGYSDYSLTARLITPTGLINDGQISWTSSNPNVVSVADGHVVSLSAGDAVVTASVVYNGVTYSKDCAFEVRAIAPGTKFVAVNEAGTLGSLLTDDEKDNISSLTVVGNLDGDDISVLKIMASHGNLAELDIYETVIHSIGHLAFEGCSSLISIVLPAGLTSIEYDAFYGCSSLSSIVLPAGISGIGGNAFEGCISLTSIKLPAGITRIGYCAFSGCSSLTSIELPAGLTNIEYATFYGCSSLSSIALPAGLTSIGEEAFEGCSSLTSIELPAGLTSIEYDAFYGCSSLSSIELPAGLTSIGGEAFSGCSSLTSILLPDGITSIEYCAFSDCSSLTAVVFPSSLTSIGYYAFKGCSSLTSIELPVGLTSIDYCAFRDCSSLTSIVLPEGLTSIGASTFSGCSSLTSIVLPDGITSIGGNSFEGCSSLTSIVLPVGITSIDYSTFSGCSSLISIDIPAGVTIMEESVFYNCSSLTSIVLPDGITSIGNNAFYNCNSLTSIILPEGLNIIGSSAFYGCSSLASITIPSTLTGIGYDTRTPTFGRCFNLKEIIIKSPFIADNFYYYFREGRADYDYDDHHYSQQWEVVMPTVVVFPEGTTKISYSSFSEISELQSFTIPSTVTVIEDYAFNRCSSLTSLTLPDGVTSIGYGAFNECSSLNSLDLPAGLTSIGGSAFSGCSSFTSIVLSDCITNIEGYAFFNCSSLTSIELSSSITSIGEYTFYGCSSLSSIDLPDGLTSIGSSAFYGCSSLTSIIIPSTLTEIGYNYSTPTFGRCFNLKEIIIKSPVIADNFFHYFREGVAWCNFNDHYYNDQWEVVMPTIVEFPEGTTKISNSSFSEIRELQSFTIPSTVTVIEDYAFNKCSSLTALTLPDGVTSIGNCAFYECSSLSSLDLPAGLTSIGGSAFSYCSALTSIDLPAGLTSIDNTAFSGCSSLTSIDIPASVTSIGESAFSGCSSLASIDLPAGLTSIGGSAFRDCSSLVSLNIPKGVTSIKDNTFGGCKSLKTVILHEGITSIEYSAFEECTSLLSMDIPEGVTNIDRRTFYNCSSLRYLSLPSTINSFYSDYWRDMPFLYCNNLDTIIVKSQFVVDNYSLLLRDYVYANPSVVILSEGITAICDNAFFGYNRMESFSIPTTVTSIGSSAFQGCSSLSSIEIPNSIINIGSSAFQNCSSLSTIEIPSSVTNIGGSAFTGCSNLKTIIIHSPVCADDFYNIFGGFYHGYYYDSDGHSYYDFWDNYDGPCSYNWRKTKLVHVEFPEGTTMICDNAFIGCDEMESFIIPSTVKSIGINAFAGCSSLTSLVIPVSVETIGENALSNIDCYFESDVPATLSSENLLGELGVAIVSPEAYEDYRQAEYWHDFMAKIARDDQLIRTVTTTASRSSSGLHVAVGEENLNSVMDLTILGTINGMDLLVIRNKMKNLRNLDLTDANIVANDDLFDYYEGGFIKEDNELGANAFKDMNIRSVILPKSLVAINDNAFQNCGRLEKVVMTGSIETIGSNAFSYCGKLASVYISDGVKNINSGAFYGCNKLSDLHMSANVKLIGDGAFYGSAIDTIIFGDSLKSIGYEAFHGNGNLKRVSLGNGIESLEPGAFSGCGSLENVDFGNHLVNIYHGAFDGCYNLKRVILPNSVKLVDYDAFKYCSSIDTLFIGHKVEYIGSNAFYGCSGIEDVTFGKSIKEIGPYAFEGCSSIKSIMLPTSLKYIRYRAFADCTGLKEFKIPSSVELIENEAFGGNRKLESVYAYTIEPITIDQNTFSCWEYATLYVPKTSYYTYYLNKQWSQFMTLREFDEPYEYFYLNDDYLLDDETGRIDGVPDMLLNENSGIIVQGDATQQINEIELVHNGKDGASIIGGDGDVTGQLKNLTAKSMKVNIDVEGNRWYFFCFPFNVDLDSIECTSQYVFWKYDGNQRAQLGTGWTKLPEGLTALSKGEGYIFQTNRTGILTIHVGSEYLTFASQTENEVLHSYAAEDVTNASWNFIGNPFISYYDTRDLAEEYDAPIITWNGRSYDVYKPGEEDEEPYQLKPFEAFFVQKASGKQSINFLPDNRLTYNQSVAAKTNFVNQRRAMGTVVNPDRLLVNLSIMDCDSVTDKTRIVYSTNASMDYEIGVDAPKFQSDGVPQLYSLAGGVKYSINERPAGNDEIKLGYVAPKAGVYTLSIPRMDADVEVYDNVLNSRVNFIDGNYDFTTKAGTFNDRFVIYKTGSSVTAIGKDIVVDGLTLHPADGGIDVSGNAAGQDVMVYLPTGALVAKLSADGFISSGLGTFIIKVGERSVKMVVE